MTDLHHMTGGKDRIFVLSLSLIALSMDTH